jgi:tRNA threonylcarbamoyladenosine biosynthesis protein TsaE
LFFVEPKTMPQSSYHATWQNEAQTATFAAQLAAALQAQLPRAGGISIALEGDLGAGKTTLVRYLLRALGVEGRIKSPSYAIVENYDTAHFPVWHFDFYRMGSAEEWEDAGFRDIFTNEGLRLVEWPGQLPAGLVPYDLRMIWRLDADELRHMQLLAGSPAGLQLLQNLEHGR